MPNPLKLAPRLFRGRVLAVDRDRRPLGPPPCGPANAPRPQRPAGLLPRATEKRGVAREGLHARRARQPQRGGDRLALPTRHRPAIRQHEDRLPGGGGEQVRN